MTTLRTFGVSCSSGGRSCWAFRKWSELTWASPASSLNASTSTYSFGSSTLRDQSNQRQPGSARVASVNSRASSGQSSACSGFTLNLATMKITSVLLRPSWFFLSSLYVPPRGGAGKYQDRREEQRRSEERSAGSNVDAHQFPRASTSPCTTVNHPDSSSPHSRQAATIRSSSA